MYVNAICWYTRTHAFRSPYGREFVTGEEELEGLPTDVQEMFTLVKEEDFRVDLSSTELRKQAEKDKLTSPS